MLSRVLGPTRRSLFPIALLGLILAVHASAVPIEPIDDAYISFRYAWHLAHGNGLVFNPGEAVEGYSNLSWVLLAAGLIRLGIPLEVGIRALGLLFGLSTLVSVRALLVRRGVSSGAATLCAGLPALSSAWVLPLLNGLEGPIFGLLLVLAADLASSPSAATPMRLLWSSGLGFLLAATRPEGGALLIAAVGMAWLVAILRSDDVARGRQAVTVLAVLAGIGTLTLWRYLTYGALVSNTVLAKSGPAARLFTRVALSRSSDGLAYLHGFIAATWPLWLLALGLGIEAWRRDRTGGAPFPWGFVCVVSAPIAASFALALANNGDWMPHYRLLAPCIPLAASLAGAFLVPARSVQLIAGALAGLAGIAPAALVRPSAENLTRHHPSAFYATVCGVSSEVARAWRSGGGGTVATEVLGVFGYCAPSLPIRDLSGLTDLDIARAEPSAGVFGRKTRPSTLETMKPDLMVINDLNYWRILNAESPWFAGSMLALACDDLLQQRIYVFVRRDASFSRPGALRICSQQRLPSRDAFAVAVCARPDWPYAFGRSCPEA